MKEQSKKKNGKKRIIFFSTVMPLAFTAGAVAAATTLTFLAQNAKIDLEVTPASQEWTVTNSITSSDLTVKAKHSDGSETDTLVWGSDYSISKDGETVEAFSTTGYKFTVADVAKGEAEFTITYLKDTSVSKKVTLNVKDRTISSLTITPVKNVWQNGWAIKASDLTIIANYSDTEASDPLVWNTNFKIKKGGSYIENFDTAGYTFTDADVTASSVTFTIQYLHSGYTTTTDFNVNVIANTTDKAAFLTQYDTFLTTYNPTGTHTLTEFVFDDDAKFAGSNVKKATVAYDSSGVATASFNAGSTKITIAGQTHQSLDDYLSSYSDALYTHTYTVSNDEISFTITSRADPTKFETVKFNSSTYITEIVNTFNDSSVSKYSNTNIKNIVYADESNFTIDTDGLVTATESGKAVEGSVLIPEYVKGTKVVGIATDGFKQAKLSTVRFVEENNITTFADAAFQGSTLTSFTLPDSVEKIGKNAFVACTNLTVFTIKSTSKLKQIQGAAFMMASLKTITLPASLQTIAAGAFSGASYLTTIAFTDTSKKWVQIGKTDVLDISNPSTNATNLVSSSWGTTGIQLQQ